MVISRMFDFFDGRASVACGTGYTIAILNDGRIRAFGEIYYGLVPADVQGLCIGVAAGDNHTIALLEDGRLRAFGCNFDDQCNVPADVQGQCSIPVELVVIVQELDSAIVATNTAGETILEIPFSKDATVRALRGEVRFQKRQGVKLVSDGVLLSSEYDDVALCQGFSRSCESLSARLANGRTKRRRLRGKQPPP